MEETAVRIRWKSSKVLDFYYSLFLAASIAICTYCLILAARSCEVENQDNMRSTMKLIIRICLFCSVGIRHSNSSSVLVFSNSRRGSRRILLKCSNIGFVMHEQPVKWEMECIICYELCMFCMYVIHRRFFDSCSAGGLAISWNSHSSHLRGRLYPQHPAARRDRGWSRSFAHIIPFCRFENAVFIYRSSVWMLAHPHASWRPIWDEQITIRLSRLNCAWYRTLCNYYFFVQQIWIC